MKFPGLVLFLLLYALSAYSQQPTFEYGLQSGLVGSTLQAKGYAAATPAFSYDPGIGYQFGGFASLNTSSRLKFTVAPEYLSTTVRCCNSNGKYIFRQINAPVTASYEGFRKLSVFAGLIPSHNLRYQGHWLFSRFGLSGTTGLSYNLARQFELLVNYDHGFTPMFTYTNTDLAGNIVGETSVLMRKLNLTLRFLIKKSS